MARNRNLNQSVSAKLEESNRLGGIYLEEIKIGERVFMETENWMYLIERKGSGFYICGNPEHCPDPIKVRILGSSWRGVMLKPAFIGRSMNLEFVLPSGATLTTAKIREVSKV